MRVFWLVVTTIALSATRTVPAWSDNCSPVTVANDSTYANDGSGPFLGKAIGQTFLAPDTLLSTITVWSPRPVYIGVHLFLFDTDSTGRPIMPGPMLDGPTLTAPESLALGELAVLRFVFDPPFALPHRGEFAMFFQGADCAQGEPWRLEVDTLAHYASGAYWESNRSQTSGCPIYSPFWFPIDFVFRVEFCEDAVTGTHRRTWGELKLLYR
jgi:hypothetical protein